MHEGSGRVEEVEIWLRGSREKQAVGTIVYDPAEGSMIIARGYERICTSMHASQHVCIKAWTRTIRCTSKTEQANVSHTIIHRI